jgi:L-fucose mutarotase
VLLTELLHPEMLSALAAAGHGGRVLIADGHYPGSTAVGPNARTVHLNLAPGLMDVSTVLDVVLRAVPVEAATVMLPPPEEPEPEAIEAHRRRLDPVALDGVDRFAFYAQARSEDLALAVITADTRTYANILLTIGVRSTP